MIPQCGVVTFVAFVTSISMIGLTIDEALDRSRTALMKAITVGLAGMSAALLAHAVFEIVHVLSLNLHMANSWGPGAKIGVDAVDQSDQRRVRQ